MRLAILAKSVNYDRNTFVAQATDLSEAIKNALNLSILLTLPADKL